MTKICLCNHFVPSSLLLFVFICIFAFPRGGLSLKRVSHSVRVFRSPCLFPQWSASLSLKTWIQLSTSPLRNFLLTYIVYIIISMSISCLVTSLDHWWIYLPGSVRSKWRNWWKNLISGFKWKTWRMPFGHAEPLSLVW